jgi:hypothetical protein
MKSRQVQKSQNRGVPPFSKMADAAMLGIQVHDIKWAFMTRF